jgi:ribosomal protein S18 acetylase RimI-like enzyme
MKPLYDQLGQTWNKAARLKQLFAGWMRYLIVMDPSDQFKLAGFCAYRIEKQGIYMYELQLDEDYRSKGLGSSLIEMLRHIAKQQ